MGSVNAVGHWAGWRGVNDHAVREPSHRHELFLHASGVRVVFAVLLGVAHAKPCFTPSYVLSRPYGLKTAPIERGENHISQSLKRALFRIEITPRAIGGASRQKPQCAFVPTYGFTRHSSRHACVMGMRL